MTCKEKMIREIEDKYAKMLEQSDNKDELETRMRDEILNIKLYKYIGETGKSSFERGSQHLSDAA